MRKIVLASASEWRKDILAKTGLPFSVDVSGYDEDLILKLSPQKLAVHIALGKAQAVAKRHSNAIIIGADTFVVFKKQIIGKPHTPQRAHEILTMLCGHWHDIITGFVILDTKTGKRVARAVTTKVHLRRASKQEIARYVLTGEPLKVAGGYAIQGRAGTLIDNIRGDYWSIAGLPLSSVVLALQKFGVEV